MDAYLKSSFWTDDRLEEQSAEIKLACLWLISNPSRDLLGITRVSNKRFNFETGLDPAFLEGACKALPRSFRQIAPGTYFAVNFLRHQFGRGGELNLKNKVIVSVIRHAAHLPKGLASPFYGAYPELRESASELPGKEEEKTSPLQAPSDFEEGVREEKSIRREVFSEEEGMQGGKPEKPAQADKPDVAGIVALYPRREGVASACSAVSDCLRRGFSADAIISGTRAIAAVISQMPGGHLNKFIPSAESFFRLRRWEDDPQTWLRASGAPGKPLELNGRGRSGTTIKISSQKHNPNK